MEPQAVGRQKVPWAGPTPLNLATSARYKACAGQHVDSGVRLERPPGIGISSTTFKLCETCGVPFQAPADPYKWKPLNLPGSTPGPRTQSRHGREPGKPIAQCIEVGCQELKVVMPSQSLARCLAHARSNKTAQLHRRRLARQAEYVLTAE